MADINIVRKNAETMMNKGATPDEISEYIRLEGFSDEDVKRAGQPKSSLGAIAQEAATKGAANVAGLPVDIWNLTGVGAEFIDKGLRGLLGLPSGDDHFQPVETGSSQYFKNLATEHGYLGNPAAQPQSDWERLLAATTEGATSGVAGLAFPGGPIARQATGALAKGGAKVAEGVMAGGTGGAAGEAAKQVFPESDIAPIIAGLIGAKVGETGLFGLPARAFNVGSPRIGPIKHFTEAGVEPTIGGVNQRFARIQDALSSVPGGASMERSRDASLEQLAKRADEFAGKFGRAANPEEGGAAIKQAVSSWRDDFRKEEGILWNQDFRAKLPQDATAPLANTFRAIRQMNTDAPGMENMMAVFKSKTMTELEKSAIDDIIKSLSAGKGGEVPLNSLLAFRSRVGSTTVDSFLGDINSSEVKRLYGAITKDIEAAAKKYGAYQEFKAASDFTKRGHEFSNRYLKRLGKDDTSPEQAFRFAARDMQGGSTQEALVNELSPRDMQEFTASVIRTMGNDAEGNFSASAFYKNWNKMSPKAKNALAHGDKELIRGWDNIGQVSGSMRALEKFSKNSKTAGMSYILSLVTSIGGAGGYLIGRDPQSAMMGAASGVASTYAASKLLSWPPFVRMMATPFAEKDVPNRLEKLQRLAKHASVTPSVRDGVTQLIQLYKQKQLQKLEGYDEEEGQ